MQTIFEFIEKFLQLLDQYGTNALLVVVGIILAIIYVPQIVRGQKKFIEAQIKITSQIAESARRGVIEQRRTRRQIKLLADKTEAIRTANAAEALAAVAMQKQLSNSHEFSLEIVRHAVNWMDVAAQKAGMQEELQEHTGHIRALITARSAEKKQPHQKAPAKAK